MQKIEQKRLNNNVPEKRISAGAITVTIWRNETKQKDGSLADFSTISIQRNYQDGNGQWQHTNSLRLNDLPKASLALSKAYEYLVLREKEQAAEE